MAILGSAASPAGSASRRNELSWRFVAGLIERVREVRAGEDAIANTRVACSPEYRV